MESYFRRGKNVQEKSGLNKTGLSILSKQIIACFRSGRVNTTKNLLEKYKEFVFIQDNSFIFEVIGLYVDAGLKCARGDETNAFERMLAEALSKTELIEPGIVTATVYAFAATVLDDTTNLQVSPHALSATALAHIRRVPDFSEVLDDIRKKAYSLQAIA